MKSSTRLCALLLGCSLLVPAAFSAGPERFLLTQQYSRGALQKHLVRDRSWVGYPAYRERAAWDALPEAQRRQAIAAGERHLGRDWPGIKATDYLVFTRTGGRQEVDDAISRRNDALAALLMAELMEGKGRFIDDLINGVFSTCESTYWGSSAHFYLYGHAGTLDRPTTVVPDIADPIIDIRVADTVGLLSWIYHFMRAEFDQVSPVISRRLAAEIKSKVLEPYYGRNDFWWLYGWDGNGNVNNWNLWCNYNVLLAILLVEDDPRKRLDGIYKSLSSVDVFINAYPGDGSCSEGPGYWGAAVGRLFSYLDLMRKITAGKIDLFGQAKIRAMARYILHVYISEGRYYVNFADAPPQMNHDAGRIYRIGRSIGDEEMKAFAGFLHGRNADRGEGPARLDDLFDPVPWPLVAAKEPLPADYHFPDWDVAIARDSAGTTDGFYFSAKGGHNDEQHNHNDVGSFMLYYNGLPVFIDVGPGTYTRETFGRGRYGIWTMQSDYHNIPLINGVAQVKGRAFRAENSNYEATAGVVRFSTDIAKAYPPEAAVASWRRGYTLERGRRFIVEDRFELTSANGKTAVHFMTNLPAGIVRPGVVALKGEGFVLHLAYDASAMRARIEERDIDDPKLVRSVGPKVSRLVFEPAGRELTGAFRFEVTPAN